MFSFGTLCHVSFEGIEEYAKNLHKKLKTGANCFWMIGDYNKNNYSVKNADKLGILQRITPPLYLPYNKNLSRLMSNLYFFRNNIFLISFQVNICISLLFFSSIFIEYNQRGLSRPFRK